MSVLSFLGTWNPRQLPSFSSGRSQGLWHIDVSLRHARGTWTSSFVSYPGLGGSEKAWFPTQRLSPLADTDLLAAEEASPHSQFHPQEPLHSPHTWGGNSHLQSTSLSAWEPSFLVQSPSISAVWRWVGKAGRGRGTE